MVQGGVASGSGASTEYQGDFPELPEDLRGHFDRLFAEDAVYEYATRGGFKEGYPDRRYMTVWEAEIENLRQAERMDVPDRDKIKPLVNIGWFKTRGGVAADATGRQLAEYNGTTFLYENTRKRQMDWVRQTLSQYDRETILDMMYGRKGRALKQRGIE